MQLYYFKVHHGNFGDDLNPWLWPQLLPELMQGAGDELLVGIGTLLNHRLPAAPLKHVFGSGHGYGRKPVIDGQWRSMQFADSRPPGRSDCRGKR
jgi:succinoglycan biosynthesis protein ExoV